MDKCLSRSGEISAESELFSKATHWEEQVRQLDMRMTRRIGVLCIHLTVLKAIKRSETVTSMKETKTESAISPRTKRLKGNHKNYQKWLKKCIKLLKKAVSEVKASSE